MAQGAPKISNVALCSMAHEMSSQTAHIGDHCIPHQNNTSGCVYFHLLCFSELTVKFYNVLVSRVCLWCWTRRKENTATHLIKFGNTRIPSFFLQRRHGQQNRSTLKIPISNMPASTSILQLRLCVSLTSAGWQRSVWTAGTQVLIVISVAYQADWHP